MAVHRAEQAYIHLQGSLLLTWINFNPSSGKWSQAQCSVGSKLLVYVQTFLKFRNGWVISSNTEWLMQYIFYVRIDVNPC